MDEEGLFDLGVRYHEHAWPAFFIYRGALAGCLSKISSSLLEVYYLVLDR